MTQLLYKDQIYIINFFCLRDRHIFIIGSDACIGCGKKYLSKSDSVE